MNALSNSTLRLLLAGALAAFVAGCGSTTSGAAMGGSAGGSAGGSSLTLTGGEEVPPVTTSATGTGRFTVGSDGSIQGKVTTTGIDGTAAHIHMAPRGQNGGVIVPLAKSGDNEWSTASGAKLTDAQLAAYRAGGLYVNVHSAANPGGEVRAQLKGG